MLVQYLFRSYKMTNESKVSSENVSDFASFHKNATIHNHRCFVTFIGKTDILSKRQTEILQFRKYNSYSSITDLENAIQLAYWSNTKSNSWFPNFWYCERNLKFQINGWKIMTRLQGHRAIYCQSQGAEGAADAVRSKTKKPRRSEKPRVGSRTSAHEPRSAFNVYLVTLPS